LKRRASPTRADMCSAGIGGQTVRSTVLKSVDQLQRG
jgi:hypothetical protein